MICLTEKIPIYRRCGGYYLRWYYNGWHYWYFYPGDNKFKTEGEKYRTIGTRIVRIGTGQITEEQVTAIRTIMNTREVYIYTDSGWGVIRIVHAPVITYDHVTHGYQFEIDVILGSRAISATGFSPAVVIPPRDPDPLCEVDIDIALQTWMCKNWDADYPGSKVYNNTEANRVIYGGLYTWTQIMSDGFIPAGYHIPTLAEWSALLAAVGGFATAGGKLKEIGTDHWDAPNSGAVDTYTFTCLGAGYYGWLPGPVLGFGGLKTVANMWTATEVNSSNAYAIQMKHNAETAIAISVPKNQYFPLRLIKDTYTAPVTPPVTIKNGLLYNFPAIADARNIANVGWHVCTYPEWRDLVLYVDPAATETNYGGYLFIDSLIAGGKLKEIGFVYWDPPNDGADNAVGFNARGSGNRYDGIFDSLQHDCAMWLNTAEADPYKYFAFVGFDSTPELWTSSDLIHQGYSVRLVKDSTTKSHGETGTYTRNDGVVQRTICINGVEFLADHLAETKYRNGDSIPEVTDNATWAALATGAMCAYNNDWNNV